MFTDKTNDYLYYVIDKSEIINSDFCNVEKVFRELDNDFPIHLRNKVSLFVSGYDNDSREIYTIPEVRTYFMRLFNEYDSFFFWIDPNCSFFIILGLILYPPEDYVDNNGIVYSKTNGFYNYLIFGFRKLNRFCDSKGVSDEPSSSLINKRITEVFGNCSF